MLKYKIKSTKLQNRTKFKKIACKYNVLHILLLENNYDLNANQKLQT